MNKTLLLFVAIPLSVVGFTLLWFGGDGLLVNIDDKLKVFDISEVEKNGVGSARFVEIKKGIALGAYTYTVDDLEKINNVYFPLGSEQTIIDMYQNKVDKIKINVLIQDKKPDPNCLKTKSCISFGEINVRGVTRRRIDYETRKAIERLNDELIEVADDLVIVEDNTEPHSVGRNIIMILVGMMFVATLVFAIIKNLEPTTD